MCHYRLFVAALFVFLNPWGDLNHIETKNCIFDQNLFHFPFSMFTVIYNFSSLQGLLSVSDELFKRRHFQRAKKIRGNLLLNPKLYFNNTGR